MTIAKFNERALLELGLDRQTVAALRHIIAQTGNEVGARNLPYVATQTAQIPVIAAQTAQIPVIAEKIEVLDLHASLQADAIAGNSASDVSIVGLSLPGALKAGMTLSGKIVGVTSNGNTPGTLNLWLSVAGVKVFAHAFTTPDVVGSNKGFAADFTLTVRAPGTAMAGGVLSLAYNAPTVLPSAALTTFAVPTTGAAVALGMNWSAANVANIATAKVAYLSVDKL